MPLVLRPALVFHYLQSALITTRDAALFPFVWVVLDLKGPSVLDAETTAPVVILLRSAPSRWATAMPPAASSSFQDS